MRFAEWLRRKPLSQRIHPDKYPRLPVPYVEGMITNEERGALACFAQQIWDNGARHNALVIDAGCYVGASTVALAEGLRHSSLPQSQRGGRIWCYDFFQTTPAMSKKYLQGYGLKPGDSFQPVFEKNVSEYADYIRVHAGDIQKAPVPSQPVAILFVDMLWSWDSTNFVGRNFYPLLEPGRSLLIHQDFVYPFYPWLILSMGLLTDVFEFSYNVRYSSVVFDVKRKVRPQAIEDPRNIPLARAIKIFDGFVDRLNGWGRGVVTIGKALYLASLNRVDDAKTVIEQVALEFADEPLVTQYLDEVRSYCNRAVLTGRPVPLDDPLGRYR